MKNNENKKGLVSEEMGKVSGGVDKKVEPIFKPKFPDESLLVAYGYQKPRILKVKIPTDNPVKPVKPVDGEEKKENLENNFKK